jgi:hypothetical protein
LLACDEKGLVMKANQKAGIYMLKVFLDMVKDFMARGKVGEKRGEKVKFMILLSNIPTISWY